MEDVPRTTRREGSYGLRGLFTALGPFAVLIALLLDAPGSFLGAANTLTGASLAYFSAVGGAILLGGLLAPVLPRLGGSLSLLGLVALNFGILPAVLADPVRALPTMVASAALATLAFGPAARIRPRVERSRERQRADAVWSSSLVAGGTWLLVVGEQVEIGAMAFGLALGVFGIVGAHSLAWLLAASSSRTPRQLAIFLAPLLPFAAAVASWPEPYAVLSWLMLHQLTVLAITLPGGGRLPEWARAVVEHPARLLVVTFAVLCLFGGLVLSFPVCAAEGRLDPLDALFTAVSAACVTGLAVLDTPNDFSFVGQVVIAALFQVGGLGIMTFSTAGTLLLGGRLGLRAEAALKGVLSDAPRQVLPNVVRRILVATFAIESLGAAALATLFHLDGDPPPVAVWRGVFTAISAFCNAGFALQSNSLVDYSGDPLVLHTVAALIVLGGLGTSALAALPELWRGRHVSVQVRIVLWTTVILLVGPALFLGAAEWTNTLGALPWPDRLHNAWFQSVTLRTAGFNSIDLAAAHPATQTVMMAMMFIGGSPGSTAGGIKTTTAAILALAVFAGLRGRPAVTVFGRRLDHASFYKATAVAIAGLMSVGVAVVALQLTQAVRTWHLVFEAVSALATVGLSLGATTELDGVGKIVVIFCMFLGRVGPLSLFMLLATPSATSRWTLPEESVNVG